MIKANRDNLERKVIQVKRKNIRDIKMWILGLIGTIFSTIVIALLRTVFGI
ncbi:DUF2951 family protein [Staphylococcus aureus]|uniref:DUF2951 family protein n=1 Tax=Staphylococcus aureus TaxID=1280 RepID=UPI0037CA83FA